MKKFGQHQLSNRQTDRCPLEGKPIAVDDGGAIISIPTTVDLLRCLF